MLKTERFLKNEQLAKKWSFEGNCEILRTIFKPRALSSNIQQAGKRFIYFITLWLISETCVLYCGKVKRTSDDLTIFLLDFIKLWLDYNNWDLKLWCSFFVFLVNKKKKHTVWTTVIKLEDCYRLITAFQFLPHDVFCPLRYAEINRWVVKIHNLKQRLAFTWYGMDY